MLRSTATGSRPAAAKTGDTAAPFLLGVASGDPTPDAVILWTRLVRNPYEARSIGSRAVQVRWQDLLWVNLVGLGTTLLASLIPARRAAGVEPARILR